MTDNNKHLVRVGHEFAAAMSDDTPIITIAKMVTELASALDVQTARSEALAVENAALKAGQLFFMYSDETGFEIHKSQERAIASAKDMIAVCREEAVQDGWPEDADTICWGVIMQKAIETNFEKPSEQNGWIGWSEYNLNPELETPTTDAWVKEQRAAGRVEGVNFAAARLAAAFNHGFIDKPTAEVYDVVKAVLGAKEELATAPDDGLSGEYAEQALNDWAAQLRGSEGASS